jgi:hypothetical protein
VTDGIDQAIVNAVLGLLRADAAYNAVCPTHDGIVPDKAPRPYRLVYTNINRPAEDLDNALNGLSQVWVPYFYIHNVGGGMDASAARAVAQRTRTQLLDVRPNVAGLACGRIRLEDAQPPQRDETTGTPVMDAVQVFTFRAMTS